MHLERPKQTNVPAKVWSTKGLAKPFGYWQETVSQAYTALSPEPVDSRPFHGQIKLFELADDASISSIKAGAQIVRRTRQDIQLRACEAVFINFQLQGQSTISQRGIEAKIDAGSLVLLDATEPFAMKFDRQFEQACLHLPKSALEVNGIRASEFVGRAVTRQSGFAAPLFSAIDSLTAGVPAPHVLPGLMQMLSFGLSNARRNAVADQHLVTVQNFVVHNMGNSDLSPGLTARHFRISTRHLHKLFARDGITFGTFLLDARLQACRKRILASPDEPVSLVAFAHGFRSQSHFSRAFRQKFGCSPNQLRKSH
ncbi:AraC-type DNA-binding domain-containing protein [Hoeflea phototrophica DFL-43]|jgi:AraC-like DNA-binding protein|uniref:AraC-type DNA-binding domain-containing protein n=1 Tax=Hoeflea phototrophica (strain DSM 17068 / NCIMB 14078 / DFL-43) TaxID=411684 RepID=A9D8L4_HOEPD|nr:helix-turn-helix domain-containing protein [Hoeflea phototrophica]EDQ32752.1 AraC-type DNA-binding domain-containing protein [Hoeflea phototrophica DFL-43]